MCKAMVQYRSGTVETEQVQISVICSTNLGGGTLNFQGSCRLCMQREAARFALRFSPPGPAR